MNIKVNSSLLLNNFENYNKIIQKYYTTPVTPQKKSGNYFKLN